MNFTKKYQFSTIFFLLLFNSLLYAQDNKVLIEIKDKNIHVDKLLIISVLIKGSEGRDVKNFPEIPHFKKRIQEAKSVFSTVSGQTHIHQQISQQYIPEQVGTFKIAPFSLSVNGQTVPFEGATIVVSNSVQLGGANTNSITAAINTPKINVNKEDDFSDFINNEATFLDVKEDAFLALNTSKSKVFVGEGIKIKLSLYVAETNAAEMKFSEDLELQMANIIKQIISPNCLIEDFKVTDIQSSPLKINGKAYAEYKLYQAVYYPLNTQPIVFPSVNLKMIKFKIAKDQLLAGKEKQKSYTIFKTKPVQVTAIDLPQHPLKNQVSVGVFKWENKIAQTKVATGKSFQVDINIVGEGNILGINMPQIQNDSLFDFYPPDVQQAVSRSRGIISGNKTFSYQVIPKQAGKFALGKYFRWTYFNPNTQQYVTLSSDVVLDVQGETIQDSGEIIGKPSLYDNIETLDSSIKETDYPAIISFFANIFIVSMLAGTIYLIFEKYKKQ
jgi:BatD DUF11 like domain